MENSMIEVCNEVMMYFDEMIVEEGLIMMNKED